MPSAPSPTTRTWLEAACSRGCAIGWTYRVAPQVFHFQDVTIRPGDRVTLTLVDVYPGEKFADTAITEINLYGAH